MTPVENAVLRAVRAEARRAERQQMLDMLAAEQNHCHRQANALNTKRPHTTSHGRRAQAMSQAIDVLTAPGSGWYANNAGDPVGVVVSAVDTVELYHFDPPTEPDEYPVRLVVDDGADSVRASAYLTVDEAEAHARAVLELVDLVRAERAARPPADQDGPP